MSQLVKPKTINISELLNNSNTTLSLNIQTKMVDLINEEFNEFEQQWYVSNLFMYMHYHPTNDYPVNLDDVFKMIGFAHKGNIMNTITNHFTEGEDYKVALFHTEKRKNEGGHNKEIVMLNIDTFKNLCLMAKTEKGKEIRKYYVKLENIYNKIIKEEIDKNEILLQKEKQEKLKLLKENKEKEILLLKEKENTLKLLEEKDRYIAQLKDQECIPILYIGHNPIIKNKHKIGISSETKKNDILVRRECHKSSNPDFEFLFTYETKNAKLIEDFIKLVLKPFKLQKPEWFSISYEKMKMVVDFAIMIYDNYHIQDSIDNLIEFISRYRSNRLLNMNKARVHIPKNIYQDWFDQNVTMIPNGRINTELICKDFYEWYKIEHCDKLETSHIKLETGNWSTSFQKEIVNTIIEITNLEYKQSISYSNRKRGIHFSNCAGFIGFEVKSMSKRFEFFDKCVYETYVNEFITVTNNPKNKVARKEILDHFLIWVKNNNYISKNKIICRTAISSIFKDVLIENIEDITGLKIQDVCKLTYFGCFVGMHHTEYPFIGNESPQKELLSNMQLIKSQIDSWMQNQYTKISKIFRKTIEQNNKISESDVKLIMKSKFNIDITSNKRKTNWHLVFDKRQHDFFIREEALNYYNKTFKN